MTKTEWLYMHTFIFTYFKIFITDFRPFTKLYHPVLILLLVETRWIKKTLPSKRKMHNLNNMALTSVWICKTAILLYDTVCRFFCNSSGFPKFSFPFFLTFTIKHFPKWQICPFLNLWESPAWYKRGKFSVERQKNVSRTETICRSELNIVSQMPMFWWLLQVNWTFLFICNFYGFTIKVYTSQSVYLKEL